MKILQLISSAGFYGAEAMVLHLSEALGAKGHDVAIGVFNNSHNPHTELLERARDSGLRSVELTCAGRFDFGTIRRIAELTRSMDVDVVHSHGYKSNAYALLANRLSRRALVSTCHNWTSATAAIRTYSHLDRFILRYFDQVLGVSEDVSNSLLTSGLPGHRISVVQNGIPISNFSSSGTRLFPKPRSESLVVGMVGRLDEAKGFQFVLHGARAILAQYPQTHFVIVGDGQHRKALSDLCTALGIEKNVFMSGKQTDMPAVYRSMDMLVLPSLNEGMPMTILEAMAAGIPVIASRVGAIPKCVHPYRTGLLVEPGDVLGLQNAILSLLGNAELRSELGKGGQLWAKENCSIELTSERYLRHYEKAMALRKRTQ